MTHVVAFAFACLANTGAPIDAAAFVSERWTLVVRPVESTFVEKGTASIWVGLKNTGNDESAVAAPETEALSLSGRGPGRGEGHIQSHQGCNENRGWYVVPSGGIVYTLFRYKLKKGDAAADRLSLSVLTYEVTLDGECRESKGIRLRATVPVQIKAKRGAREVPGT